MQVHIEVIGGFLTEPDIDRISAMLVSREIIPVDPNSLAEGIRQGLASSNSWMHMTALTPPCHMVTVYRHNEQIYPGWKAPYFFSGYWMFDADSSTFNYSLSRVIVYHLDLIEAGVQAVGYIHWEQIPVVCAIFGWDASETIRGIIEDSEYSPIFPDDSLQISLRRINNRIAVVLQYKEGKMLSGHDPQLIYYSRLLASVASV